AGDLPEVDLQWLDDQVQAILSNQKISRADLARAKALNARMSTIEAIPGAAEAFRATKAAQFEANYPSDKRSAEINEEINRALNIQARRYADHRAAVVA